MKKEKTYIYRVYTITEYEIQASSRKEAKKKLFTEDIAFEEWIEKTTLKLKTKEKKPYRDDPELTKKILELHDKIMRGEI